MNRQEFFSQIFLKNVSSLKQLNVANPTTTLKKYKGKWDEAAVTHFLKRTMFGAKQNDIAYFKNMSLKKTVEEILQPAPSITSAPLNNYNDDKFTDPDVQMASTWVNVTNFNGMSNGRRRNSYKQWWMGNMINQNRSITEKMVLFWHNHFSTETNVVDNSVYSYRHNLLLRKFALGNFKEFVKAVTVDLCMLRYLNGYASTKKAPDENYGRELQELFTVGKGPGSQYTEADVKAAARVLTGYKIDNKTLTVSFDPSRHDDRDKQFSAFYANTLIKGRKGQEGGGELDDLFNIIFAQEEMSKFICRKLYRFFVFYSIDASTEQNIIAPLAKIFRKNNFEIQPVLKVLFSSRHFFDKSLRGTMIKSPVDFTVGLVREYNINFPEQNDYLANYSMWEFVRSQAAAMQQNIGDPPNVAGWQAYYQQPQYYKLWINSDTLPKRDQYSDRFCANGFATKDKKTIDIDVIEFASSFPHPEDPDALVNDSIAFLYTVDVTAAEKNYIKSNLLLSNLQGMEANHYWTNAWNNLKDKPTDLINKKLVTNKLKGLYKYLMNRPEYQVY